MRRTGFTAIYALLGMSAFVAVTALALDWARVQLVKTELTRAADAAALHAIRGLRDGTYATRAVYLAGEHKVDGSVLTITAADVEAGTWNKTTNAFTPGGANTTSVRVTARRTVSLTFLPILGITSQHVTVEAVAKGGTRPYGLIGLNSVSITGNGAATSSYASAAAVAPGDRGDVASNGNITLGGSAQVNGKTYSGGTSTGGTVTGGRESLPAPISYPNGDAATFATSNNNGSIPTWAYVWPGVSSNSISLTSGAVLTLPAGNYYLKDITMSGGSELKFAGPSTVYCYGNFHMTGNTETSANLPQNLRLVMCPGPGGVVPGSVYVSSSANLYASIYAPQSAITIAGSGSIYGSVLGKTVSISGSAQIVYDLSLDHPDGKLSLVD